MCASTCWVVDFVCVVQGGGSGLGRLMALRFADLGARVVLWDVNTAGNEETARLVRERNAEVHHYTVDLSDRTQIYRYL